MNKNKLVYKGIALLLSSMVVVPSIANSYVEVSAKISAGDYFRLLNEDEIIPYVYSNDEVNQVLDDLVNRTNKLKTDYSKKETIKILEELKDINKKITKKDFENQQKMKEDPNNYEKGNFYKNKYFKTEYIEKNIVAIMYINALDDDVTWKSILDIIYDIGTIELNNGSQKHYSYSLITDMSILQSEISKELAEYFKIVSGLVSDKSTEFESNGTIPSDDKTLSDLYEDYVEEKKKEEEEIKNSKDDYSDIIVEEEEPIEIDENIDGPAGYHIEDYDSTNNVTNTNNTTNTSSWSDYLKTMNNIANGSYVGTNNKEAVEYSIYYTTNKSKETSNWVDSRLTITNTDKIDFVNLISVLQTISKYEKNSYVFEDSDMIMFVADGQNIVINKKDKLTSDEINNLFNDFKDIGLKVLLKSDEEVDEKDSLENRVENGEVNKISVNDKDIILTEKPIITKGILQLPLKQTSEALGYSYSQSGNKVTLTYKKTINVVDNTTDEELETNSNKEDETLDKTQTTKETIDTTTIEINIGSTTYTINGARGSFKAPVTKSNGVVYVEFDKLASIINYNYSYNTQSNVIEFSK